MAQRPKIQLKKAFLRHAGKIIKKADIPKAKREYSAKHLGYEKGLGKPVHAPPDKHPAPQSVDDLIGEAQAEIAAEEAAESAAVVVVEPEKTAEKSSFKLNPGQMKAIPVVTGPARHTLVFGGARSGKTFLFTRFIIVRALKCDGSRHAILRFRANAVKSSIVEDTFPAVMRECFPGIRYELKLQAGYFELPNGSQVWFGGLDDKSRVEKILGQEFSTLYFNECSQIPYSSIMVARTRLAQKTDLKQRAFYDLNPTGTGHWSYLEFVSKLNPLNRNPIRNPDDFQFAVINPMDNVENLDQAFLDELEGYPEKLRKRFFEGKFVDEIDGALWTYELIEQCRVELREKRPEFVQIVVAVDPSGAAGKEDERSDDIGIVVVGLTSEKTAYVIADYTMRDSPQKWGQKAVWAYRHHKADRIVCEKNFGGEMVRFVLQTADSTVPVKMITASLGKHIRAEPISALYEQGTVKHYGRFPELEDQLVNFSSSGYQGDRSPDRADAAIWALTDLLLGSKAPRAYVGRYSMRR